MRTRTLFVPLVVAALAACNEMGPPPATSPSYAPVAQASHVQYGTIVSVRPVTMQRTAQGDQIVGAVAGGLVGAVIGNQFGEGSGKDLMTGAGALTGALVGSHLAQQHSGTYQSQAWTVRMRNGGTVTIVQASNSFYVGQHVRVVSRGHEMYIEP